MELHVNSPKTAVIEIDLTCNECATSCFSAVRLRVVFGTNPVFPPEKMVYPTSEVVLLFINSNVCVCVCVC